MVNRGKRIKEERERLGLTQTSVGVTPKTQRFYESGERAPDANYLENFATLGADVLYIVTGQRSTGVLSSDEFKLVTLYRNAPEAKQQSLLDIISSLADSKTPKTKIKGAVGQVVEGNLTTEGGSFVINMPGKTKGEDKDDGEDRNRR